MATMTAPIKKKKKMLILKKRNTNNVQEQQLQTIYSLNFKPSPKQETTKAKHEVKPQKMDMFTKKA